MKKNLYRKTVMVLSIMLLSNISWATWNPSMPCNYSIAYSVTTATRDNRGIALSQDGQYLYLGYNNGPDFRKIQISNRNYLGGNTTDRAKNIAIDDQGRVYTTGPDGNPVKIYSSDLTTLLFSIPMTKCEGIAVKREAGILYLYATERNAGTLSRFLLTESGMNITGYTLNGLDGDGVVSITGGSGIRGVAIGPDGKILVANPGAGIIYKLNADGSGQTDYHYSSNDNPYYFAIIDGQVFVTHGSAFSASLVAVINYNDMSLAGTITPPYAALGLKTTDPVDMISGIAAFSDNKGFYITYEDGSASDDSFKEPVIKVSFPTVHNITQNTFFTTIQLAINASSNGDIIEVDAGTYIIPAGTQLIINKQITLRAKAGLPAKPWIRTNLLNWSACNVQIAADDVIVDGFEIDNALYGTQAGYIVGDYGSAKNNWTVKNCNIHDGRNGIRPIGNYVTIEWNDIHGTNSDCINCEYGKCGGLKVTRNILHSEWVVSGGKPAGITYNCDGTTTGDVEISYNYCYACRTFIDFQHNGGTGPANNILIMHNTVDWKMEALPSPVPSTAIAQQMSIAFWTGSGNWNASKFTIRDNIFSRQKWYAIVNTSGAAGPIVGTLNLNNNLFYQWYLVDAYYPGNAYPNEWPAARGAVGWDVTDATPSFTNDLQANPLYAATGTTPDYYYALSAGSPANNAASDGTNIGAWQSPANKWRGTVSTAWNTAANWTGNTVPAEDANIIFDIAAVNHCQLDQNRSTTNITNAQSTYRMVTNGFKLTVKGALNFTNGAQIDASATNSEIEFAGAAAQSIPSGAFYNNEVYSLTVNNGSNVVLNGTLRLLNALTATSGRLDGFVNSPSFTFAGTSSQTIGSNLFLNDIVYNLTIGNANGVILNTDLTVNNSLTINPGALFLISPEKKLNVAGTLTNNAGSSGLVLQSNPTGTASLLHHTDNVSATVQRCISGLTEAWHFISSPVSDQRIGGSWLPSGTYGNGTGYDLYLWHEPISDWIAKTDSASPVNWKTVHPGNNFMPGRGYLYAVQETNPIKSFVGNLNNGPLTFGLTASGTTPGWVGFNMIGNPYPSSVDWQAVTGWSRTSLVSNGGGYDMWIWNPDANNYGVCNSSSGSVGTNSITRYIAPMQGYFVLASGAGSITMDNPVRVLDDTHWFKNPVQNDNTISLSVNADAGYGFDEIQLGFGYAANENGAIKLFSSVATAPSLYVSKPTKEYSVQYYTNTKQNPVVPVSFKPGVNGNFTINCHFDQSKFDSVVLEDLQMHYTQNMKATKTYSFQASVTDDANRFVLRFGPDNKHSGKELPARIYSDGTHLIVDLSLVPEETEIFIYDVIGRLLFSQTVIGGIQHDLTFNADAQLLVIYLKNPNGSLCRKLLFGNNRF